jgi:protein-S-isoprenylcysteine O-methyltransferase Ste14
MSFLAEYQFLRYFLPVYIVTFYLLNLIIKTYSFRKKYQTDPLVEGKSDKLQRSIGRYKIAILISGLLTIFLYALFPGYYWLTAPILYLDFQAIKITGVSVLLVSIVFVRFSQNQLRQSWRIGVDQSEKPQLITIGIYRKTRNPIAFGMILTLAGFFMVIPNAVTCSCLCVGLVLANLRIRIEEAYLSESLGEEYEEYCKKTRKWI